MLHELLSSHLNMDDSFMAGHVITSESSKDTFDVSFAEIMTNLAAGLNTDGSERSEDYLILNSIRDISFFNLFGRSLSEAREWIFNFMKTGSAAALHQAWELYLFIFLSTRAHFLTFKRLNLSHLSSYLTQASNLSLTVPGAYKAGAPIISISRFGANIEVLVSKLRPRKIKIIGTDGHRYNFLLKGNEDLRLDERVMQLFGLINTCLNSDPTTRIDKDLAITRYSVLPLTNNSGLLEWVENCDTVQVLVNKYRESRDIKPFAETKLLLNKSLNYDMGLNPKVKNTLTPMQKVEIFRSVLEDTSGNDIAQSLWASSRTADVWIERRENFINSMALMSMSGYILGLGDRHLSNLMMERKSGRIVHIDFGDCFEVTHSRAKFSETIPFRLTRMLQNVMGSAGVRGPYKEMCMRVMGIMRENKDSIMAMLEAFVYNPLISWRFLNGDNNTEGKGFDDTQKVLIGIGAQHGGEVDESKDDGATAATAATVKDDSAGGARAERKPSQASVQLGKVLSSVQGKLNNLIGSKQFDTALAASLNVDLPLQGAFGAGATSTQPGTSADIPETNEQGVKVIQRIQSKLTGTDFKTASPLLIEDQVDRLILEATSEERLCNLWIGWMPFW